MEDKGALLVFWFVSWGQLTSVYIVFIIVTVCLLSSVYAPPSSRQTPCWSKILLGNKSVSDSDSDDSKIKPSQLQSCVNVSRWRQWFPTCDNMWISCCCREDQIHHQLWAPVWFTHSLCRKRRITEISVLTLMIADDILGFSKETYKTQQFWYVMCSHEQLVACYILIHIKW